MKMPHPLLPPHIKAALERYVEIQQIQQQLNDEKKHLQQMLKEHLRSGGKSVIWSPRLQDLLVRVNYKRNVRVDYNEKLLRERLGDRYPEILSPDVKKIRRHLDEVEGLLKPALLIIGTPDRRKVQEAVTQGGMEFSLFQGAFQKKLDESIAVSARHPQSR